MSPFDPNAAAAAGAGIFGLDTSEADARVVLIPVPWEATVSYHGGAARGPAAILRASHQVDLEDIETGRPYEAGIHMLEPDAEIVQLNTAAKEAARLVIEGAAFSDVESARILVNDSSSRLNEIVYNLTDTRLSRGKIVGVIGGDHSAPIAAMRAHAERLGPIGILHIDAHADLRPAYQGFVWSHASALECVLRESPGVSRLVQVGIRDLCLDEKNAIEGSNGRIRTWFDPMIARARARGRLLEAFKEIADALPERVYVSFDIDGLDPKLCPNTGTPVPGGLDLNEVSMLLEQIVSSRHVIVGFDLNEVAPGPDGDDWDANVGARALYKLIGWTLKSQQGAQHASR